MALLLAGGSFLSCGGAGKGSVSTSDSSPAQSSLTVSADSLNALAYSLRYKDLDASEQASEQALALAGRGTSARAEALNGLGFCAFMRMDFERADSLYTVASTASMNELERLIADIGHMKISQRTARYKAFCDYRNSANARLRRIDEDGELAASSRLGYARSELAIASSVYYYYLRQLTQSVEAIESIPVDETLQRDTAQWLYYLYMRGSGDLAPGRTPKEVTLHELDYLWPCLTVSYRQGYTYFDANASQALAEMMCVPDQFTLVTAQRPAVMKMLNPNDLSGPELAMSYARRSLEGFEEYGDLYQISGALRTIATCFNYQGRHQEALDYLSRALNLVNRHHEQYYLCHDTTDRLRPFVAYADSLPVQPQTSVELSWIQRDGILTVPEWIARLREQLSVTYAALGRKQESDYNRNIYLDLLDYTRQDKETESRYAALKAEGERLNGWLITVAVGLVVLIVACILLNRAWRRRNWRYIYRLQHVAQLCRRISSSDATEAEEARREMLRLRAAFPPHLSRDEQLQAEVIDAYLRWYDEAGRQIESLAEERECAEKERYVHQCHLVENKQENLVKKACLLVVTGILPYIDRALYTMKKLGIEGQADTRRTEQLTYIHELLTRINEYNDILALWIKMKPGALSLHIETFSLQPLFEVVKKGRQSFEQRRQTLTVQPTEATVKADKALTLFMINTLTDNARKYTQEGGCIAVDATETEDYVEVSVTDNGPGIAAADVDRLMSEKVYDAGKGHGFGLMNCRGIIEKYRKTNPFFRVCTFGVVSTPGQGSRFFFRLPKGVKAMVVLLAMTCGGLSMQGAEPEVSPLEEANRFAELVYQSNVDGYYEDAIQYADSALTAMNVALMSADSAYARLPLLTLEGQGDAAELQWLAAGFDTDYFILLDVRNEAAVAYLALGEMENYRYNNAAYAALYKQLSVDTSLEDYCRQMQRSAGAKTVLLIVVLLLVVALSVVSYLHYFHHRLLYRDRMEQILLLSRRLLDEPEGAASLPVEGTEPLPEPLSDSSSDAFVSKWMQDLIALRAYYVREWMGGKREDIDAIRNEVNRIVHEENRLHVQNRVLDNCLSALKHETVYYPHRIQGWVEKKRAGATDNASVDTMIELMTYYKEIYTTLTACAARQLDEVTFRCTRIPLSEVMGEARRTFARMARRTHRTDAALVVEAEEGLGVMADSVQLQYLLACLFGEALSQPAAVSPCPYRLTARSEGTFVRLAFTDPSRTLTAEQLATLFDPHLDRMHYVEGDRLTGVEYLIAKQVIRDHDTYAGRRGCRIQAETSSPEGGLTVWFTLPGYRPVQVEQSRIPNIQ
jgi:signal transduction histidine kinase